MKKQIEVVGAVVVVDGEVLCLQRGPSGALPGMWEFPGGKVEHGESPQDALRREIREELECDIAVGEAITTTTYDYDFGVVTLTTYYCRLLDGTPRLVEHADLEWRAPERLRDLEWAPADIPAVELVVRDLTASAQG